MSDSAEPVLRGGGQHSAEVGSKLVDKTNKYQQKAEHVTGKDKDKDKDEKTPAGGYDKTPVPHAPPGYTLRFTFHRATNLPFADLSLSSDPYVAAVLKTDLPKRHKQDSDLMFRTPTIHRNTDPKWDSQWTIAHIPASGFSLKCRLYDEDPTDHDDRLGNVHVDVGRIDEQWSGMKEQSFEIKKRMGSKRAYTLRGCAALFSRSIKMAGNMIISIENLGKSEGESGGRPYTIGPLHWTQHFSPLIGRIAGVKEEHDAKDGKKATSRYNFQAIQMQLQGPVPEQLYHRYVEFRPFVAGMFTSHTLRGRILNHALHHQHARIYNFDSTTKYGSYDEPCLDMTKRFIDFVHYDQGGRIFTYVLTLDGQFRFTETGKEFGVDLLSKHTMHSDVAIYIAFSGEFFIRRLKHPHKDKNSSPDPETEALPPATEKSEDELKKENRPEHHQDLHNSKHSERQPNLRPTSQESQTLSVERPGQHRGSSWFSRASSARSPGPHAEATHPSEDPTKDPHMYELIIDNDSGTYRPNAGQLHHLKKFFAHNFPGLRVVTLDCQKDEEKMKKLKSEQAERKKNSGKQVMYMQNSSMSSISSSDEEELEERAAGTTSKKHSIKKQLNKTKDTVLTGGGFLTRDKEDDNEKDDVNEKNTNAQEGSSHSESHPKPTTQSETEKTTTNTHSSTEHTHTEKTEPTHDQTHSEAYTGEAAAATTTTTTRQQEKSSISSTGDNKSFNTAHDYLDTFVTPKPSLADGGLRSFDNNNYNSNYNEKISTKTSALDTHNHHVDVHPGDNPRTSFHYDVTSPS